MNNEVTLAQFRKSVSTLAKTVCKIIVDVKEKKKTAHIGLAEIGVFISMLTAMMNNNSANGRDILQPLIDLCTEAKACLEGDLN
jgi:hypothetical protein